MDAALARAIGARVRSARAGNRQTQVVVAGLTGITTDYLYQIERGKKLPTLSVLTQLAKVLNVPTSTLLAEPCTPVARPRADVDSDTGKALHRALTQPGPASEPPVLPELHDQVRSAWRVWQTSPHRYSKLGTQLPILITAVKRAEQLSSAEDPPLERRNACRCAADLYGLLRTVAKRVGRADLSLLVADRAIRAAEAADDPLRLAAAQWNLAHVLLAEDEPGGAESIAMCAADALSPLLQENGESALDAAALVGALTLLGAVAAVRHGQVWTARERIRQVAPLAQRTGERNVHWTAFGPTNVAMHAVNVEVEAGDTAEGLRLAENVVHDRSPSIERRVAFLLDQAKGYSQRKDFGSALALLQVANREAPEDVANRPTSRRLLTTVIQRGRRGVAAEAAHLAQAVGLDVG